jgi:hypothetical protein
MSNNVSNKDLQEDIVKLRDTLTEYIIASEHRITVVETLLENQKGEVDTLKKRDYIVVGINTVAATIAGILGVNR